MSSDAKHSEPRQGKRTIETGDGMSYLPGFSYDVLLPLYDPVQKLLGLDTYHRELVEQADIQPGHDILEIGCGTGNMAILVKRLHPHADVVGLDPDPKALARAQRKVDRERLPVLLDRGFAEELPYPDASFDRVFSAFMFHHLDSNQKRDALREARRVLRPGSSLHLLDFGGATRRSKGLIARLSHRSERLADNFGDRIPTLMRSAGFVSPEEVGHQEMLFGRIAYFRGLVAAADL